LREHARLQERRLAQPRLTEEHGERLALDQAQQRTDLLVAAVEEAAFFLGEWGEARPGVDRVGGRRGTRAGCAGTLNIQR
jgi:hypothetical protein